MCLHRLPDELWDRILRTLAADDPLRALAHARLTCRLWHDLIHDYSFRHPRLLAPWPSGGHRITNALASHIAVMLNAPSIGPLVRTLAYEGRSTDLAPNPAMCARITELALLELCRLTPNATEYTLNKLYWDKTPSEPPNANIERVTYLSILAATVHDDVAFPQSITRHFPHLRHQCL